MKRRSAVKNLAIAAAGLISLPAWARGWNPGSLGSVAILPVSEENLLAEVVETIIPETNTPGAKSLQVHQFVLRMIQDCYGEAARTNLKQGLITLDEIANGAFNKSFVAGDATQRTAVLSHMQQGEDMVAKQFVSMIKNLTIQGYMNSEYVMVNLLNYNMAPGFYHGCVPVKV